MKSKRKLVPGQAPPFVWAVHIFVVLVALSVAVLALISIESGPKKNAAAKPSNTGILLPKLQITLPDLIFSVEAQKIFWDENLKTPVVEDLMGPNGYHIPEIRERYMALKETVERKYGPLFVNCSPNYAHNSKEIAAGCDMLDGKPTIIFFIRAQMDIYATLRATAGPNWHDKFQLSAVITVIHELEHLAADDMSKTEESTTLDDLVINEKRAWDRTCRYTIDVLVQKYQTSLDPSHEDYYRAWLATGRSENSPEWETFIREGYRKTKE